MNLLIFSPQDFESPSSENKIGMGSFGTVYKLKEKLTGQVYAVKHLNNDDQDEFLMESFINEIAIIAKLKYPTLLHLHGIFLQNPYSIITEYLPNKSIDYYINRAINGKKDPKWNATHKVIIIIGISLGMQHLHSLQIVHRDLKPGNILLDMKFYPRICDFGLAKTIGSSKMMSSAVGTPAFCPPEVFSSSNYSDYNGEKADVYSFAMTIYSIIFDIVPFANFPSPFSIYESVKNGNRPEIPNDISSQSIIELIIRCWDTDPMKRPDFQEISQQLINERYSIFTESVNEEEINSFLQYCYEINESGTIEKTQAKEKETFNENMNNQQLSSEINQDNKDNQVNKTLIPEQKNDIHNIINREEFDEKFEQYKVKKDDPKLNQLHFAVKMNSEEILEQLLKEGFDINVQNNIEEHLVISFMNKQIFKQ